MPGKAIAPGAINGGPGNTAAVSIFVVVGNICSAGGTAGTVTQLPERGPSLSQGQSWQRGPPSGSCTIVVAMTGATAGRKNNTVTATVDFPGPGAPADVTILILAPPVLTKVFAFNPPSVAVNASTTLTFTMTNPNPVDGLVDAALLNVTFADDMRQHPGDVVFPIGCTPVAREKQYAMQQGPAVASALTFRARGS